MPPWSQLGQWEREWHWTDNCIYMYHRLWQVPYKRSLRGESDVDWGGLLFKLTPENKYKCLNSEIINVMFFPTIWSSISVLTYKDTGLKVKWKTTSTWLLYSQNSRRTFGLEISLFKARGLCWDVLGAKTDVWWQIPKLSPKNSCFQVTGTITNKDLMGIRGKPIRTAFKVGFFPWGTG